MTSVTVDKPQADALIKTGELVEIRNSDGAVLGYFAPVKMEYAEQYAEAAARASAAYRDGRRWFTGEEVAAHLKSLEQQQ